MAQIFKATAELVIPTATPTNEAKTEIERDSNSNAAHFFMLFHSLNHYALFILRDNFLFYLFL